MDKKTIETIEAALKRGDRVELIPTKTGVKIVSVRRSTIADVPAGTE